MKKNMSMLVYGTAWCLFSSILLFLVSLDVEPEVQLYWTLTAVLVIIIVRKKVIKNSATTFKSFDSWRLLVILLIGMITLRYLWWRTFHSIPLDGDVYSMVGGILLYAAEVQAAVATLLGSFLYLNPFRRDPEAVDLNDPSLPTVDVLVPTYNEPSELLRVTLFACKNIRYPADKLNIYLLDDGGSIAFREQENAEKAKAAVQRHEEFKQLCSELNVHYLTRETNEYAKAGNINAALNHVHGDLVVVLDCDHVPTVEFLENTVKPFMQDEKLWLVQTPHFLINDDPIEKNFGKKQDMPSESELFYTLALRGMDFWNAAFFCGSGAVLRRSCLDEIGGIATQTVTEDIETSIEMHRRGYNSIYYHKPMLAGLQPESFTGFLTQRLRWAHGMIQVFLLKNPLLIRGLNFWQRLSYFNMTSFWFFSMMRLVFLLAPSAYLVFGVHLYNAPVYEVMIYALPNIVAFVFYFNMMFGRMRWFLVSDVYEILQSLFSIRTVFRVLAHPKIGKFAVTPKDENINEDFISPVANVFYILLAFLAVTVVVGVTKIIADDAQMMAMDIAVTIWSLLSFLLVLGSVGVLHEKKQVRKTTRFQVDLPSRLYSGRQAFDAQAIDLSAKGLCLHVCAKHDLQLEDMLQVEIYCQALDKKITLSAKLCMNRRLDDDSDVYVIGLDFVPQSIEEEQLIIALAYGDSERWRKILMQRNVHAGLAEGAGYFFTVCLPAGVRHVVRQCLKLFGRKDFNVKSNVEGERI